MAIPPKKPSAAPLQAGPSQLLYWDRNSHLVSPGQFSKHSKSDGEGSVLNRRRNASSNFCFAVFMASFISVGCVFMVFC